MKITPGGCYRIDAARLRRVEDPALPVGLARWRERQDDLTQAAHTIIHEHRRLTAEEIGLYHAMLSELQGVEAAIATRERDAGGPGVACESGAGVDSFLNRDRGSENDATRNA